MLSHLFSTFLESGEIACFAFLSPYVPFHGSRGREMSSPLVSISYLEAMMTTQDVQAAVSNLSASDKVRLACKVLLSTDLSAGWFLQRFLDGKSQRLPEKTAQTVAQILPHL